MTALGLVLAAGAGRRFGGPKALARLRGERLVDRAVRVLADGGCSSVVVVQGAADLAVVGARVVPNPLWHTGMGSSLRTGLAAALESSPPPDAVVVLLVDTPGVDPEAVRRVVANVQAATAAVATYDGVRGHPVALSTRICAEVAELAQGDVAAKAWLRSHPDQVAEIDCSGLGDPRDVDTPADLEALDAALPPGGLPA